MFLYRSTFICILLQRVNPNNLLIGGATIEKVYNLFLAFLIYSFFGWCIEVLFQFVEKKRFVNRGFLVGPICPIYGYGAIMIISFLSNYEKDSIMLFGMSMFICSILEYVTSYFMEKVFKTRWWDYSECKYNLNGRICADTMIPFGLLGCFVVYVLNPVIENAIGIITLKMQKYLAPILFFLFVLDNIVSSSVIMSFRSQITNIEKDATEEITKKVKNIFLEKGILARRLVNAFPTMINLPDKLKKCLNEKFEKLDRKKKFLKNK